ncbi:unannotated protein [freshwater metagenome]|uniref:Unannotated protein n=1 Tax=freshwater metagenome TaxID=449393 RepID=A0A6J7TM63_9ZZZZ
MGTIGTRTLTMRAIWGAYIPPQLTTISHSISPLSVTTLLTRPLVVLISNTRVCVKIWTPCFRAPAASAIASCDGST